MDPEFQSNDSNGPLLSIGSYGKSSKELIDIVSHLRSLGAHIDLALPRIVVIGNQSAGKSSLVEAISGINVPRDAGTCTRCPMECRLSNSPDTWSCQIKIRWEYDDVSRARLGEVEEVSFGPRLSDKRDVELMLRRAQAAVLNPSTASTAFLKASEDDLRNADKNKNQLLFTRNVICVELAGPELQADLSFVDLPGIVQNAEEDIVRLVEDLVNSYITAENSVILVTLPMSDDIENQKAARLARIADPSGFRTVGVMTKPDMLTAGSVKAQNLWLEVLAGRRHPLLHGYYCTRQPNDKERGEGISGTDARLAEANFFQTNEPWSTSALHARFGTPNLVQSISKLLTRIIQTSLPRIRSDVAVLLSGCSKQLQTLPPPTTTDPGAFVLGLITRFCGEIKEHVQGSPEYAGLVQNNRAVYEKFKTAIRSTAPPFVPYVSATDAPKDLSVRFGNTTKGVDNGVVFLQDMRNHIRTCVTRELPNNVPYAAKRALIRSFQQFWMEAALACFEDVQQAFRKTLLEIAHEYFERYSNLQAIISPVIAEQLDLRSDETTLSLQTVLKLEAAAPFTQNTHYLAEKRDKHLARYKDARAGRTSAERITPAPNLTTSGGNMPFPPANNPFAEFFPLGAPSPFRKATSTTNSQPVTPVAFHGLNTSDTPVKDRVSFPEKSIFSSASNSSTFPSSPQTQKQVKFEVPKVSVFATPRPPASTSATPRPPATTSTPIAPIPPVVSNPAATPVSAPPPAMTAPSTGPASASTSQSPFQFSSPFQSRGTPTQTSLLATASSSASPTPFVDVQGFGEGQSQHDEKAIKDALAALAKIGINVTEEDLGKLNPPDEYEEELELMAEVRAYFDVAYKRVIDYIPLSIDEHFLYAFVDALQEVLFQKLGLGSANAQALCTSYLAEDPHIVAIREELLAKKKRLENVQKALLSFGL